MSKFVFLFVFVVASLVIGCSSPSPVSDPNGSQRSTQATTDAQKSTGTNQDSNERSTSATTNDPKSAGTSQGSRDRDDVTTSPAALKGRNIFNFEFDQFPFACTELTEPRFTSALFPTDLITAIEPMGKVVPTSDHVTPTDHLYVHRKFAAGEEFVRMPGDGFIVKIGRFARDQPLNSADEDGRFLGDNVGPMVPDYRVVIMHSCNVFTILIHLGEFAPAVAAATGPIQLNDTWFAGTEAPPIALKAGDPIARFGSDSLDWSVNDARTVLEGFLEPNRYESERFKIHTVDPFEYYAEPARSQLLDKVVREAEPRSGKIDYDIEGTIAGNWFLDDDSDYAEGQLSIVYGSIDPSQVRISIGASTGIDRDLCNPCEGAYGVRGNSPDPATVNPDMGLVKYELMDRDEESRFVKDAVGTTALGTFLVQHLGDRSIRVEVIPEKNPEAVSGFSDSARVYRR